MLFFGVLAERGDPLQPLPHFLPHTVTALPGWERSGAHYADAD